MAKLLSRLFDESANFFISSTTLPAVVSVNGKERYVLMEGGGGGGGGGGERETFLSFWSGNVHQGCYGREYSLFIFARETLHCQLHSIILHQICHVQGVQAAVADPSHRILNHLLIRFLSNDIQEQVEDIELSEVVIVDRVVGKVGQIS